MEDTPGPTDRDAHGGDTVFIGSRHGSPSITVALPFSNITTNEHLHDAVMALAAMVADLADAVARPKPDRRVELARVQAAATELAERLAKR